jgi:hypothetical protein
MSSKHTSGGKKKRKTGYKFLQCYSGVINAMHLLQKLLRYTVSTNFPVHPVKIQDPFCIEEIPFVTFCHYFVECMELG